MRDAALLESAMDALASPRAEREKSGATGETHRSISKEVVS